MIPFALLGLAASQSALAATYFVDPDSGDDGHTALEAQTEGTPWKTLTHALATAVAGDAVYLSEGTFSADSGEQFPLVLVEGVQIVGQSQELTAIAAPEDGTAVFVNNGPLSYNTVVSDLKITVDTEQPEWFVDGFEFSVANGQVGLVLSRVHFDAAIATALSVESIGNAGVFSPLVEDSTFESFVGVSVFSNSANDVQIGGGYLSNEFRCLEYAVLYYIADGENLDFAPFFYGNTIEGGYGGLMLGASGGTGALFFEPFIQENVFSEIEMGFPLQAQVGGSQHDTVSFSPVLLSNKVELLEDPDGDVDAVNVIFEGDTNVHVTGTVSVRNNEVSSPSHMGSGISVWYYTSSSDTVVQYFDIDHNRVDGFATGLDVAISDLGDSTGELDLSVVGNTLVGPTYGIRMYFTPYAEVQFRGQLSGNVIETGYFGIWAWLDHQQDLSANQLYISDNLVTEADQSGIALMSAGVDETTVKVWGNVASDLDGIGFTQFGMLSDQPMIDEAWPADLGGGDLDSPGMNRFENLGEFALHSGSDHTVYAKYNDWGVTSGIDDLIYDDEEGGGDYAMVDFSEPLAEAPVANVQMSLDTAIAYDAEPSGVSVGDEVEFSAYIDNSGTAGCPVAWLDADVSENGDLMTVSTSKGMGFDFNQEQGSMGVGLQWIAAGEGISVTWSAEVLDCATALSSQVAFSCYGQNLSDTISVDCGEGDTDLPADTDPSDTDDTEDSGDTADTDDGTGPAVLTRTGCGCNGGSVPAVGWLGGIAGMLAWRLRRIRQAVDN